MKKACFVTWIFPAVICCSVAPKLFAQWVTDEPLPTRIAEDASLDLFNTVLFFDYFFTKPTTEINADYLDQIAKPSSKFHPDYLEYKQGRISGPELAQRLPHIAMIGDSLSKNFYISSPASMLWRARTERQRDWFLDTDPSPGSVYSLYERLNKITPLVATEYSTAGGLVAPGNATEPLVRRLARTHNLRGQIARLMQAKRFPDVVLIWIGHNNTDWVPRLSAEERKNPRPHLRQLAQDFGASYTDELKVLIDCAKNQKHRTAFVVFGLADFKTFFEMRAKAAALHAQNPAIYPYYDATCRYFEALQPANQANTIELGLMMNEELKKMVAVLNRQLKDEPDVRLEYSDALWKIDLSDLRSFHRMDAWHPSVFGHDALAASAFRAISPSLRFIGLDQKVSSTPDPSAPQIRGR